MPDDEDITKLASTKIGQHLGQLKSRSKCPYKRWSLLTHLIQVSVSEANDSNLSTIKGSLKLRNPEHSIAEEVEYKRYPADGPEN